MGCCVLDSCIVRRFVRLVTASGGSPTTPAMAENERPRLPAHQARSPFPLVASEWT